VTPPDPVDPGVEFAYSGMIDWLTLRIDLSHLTIETIETIRAMASTLCKISPDGVVEWQSYCWESVKSDTHQVCVRVGSDLWIQGSPARVGLPNNMFGALDIRYCAHKMIAFASSHLGLGHLPPYKQWSCTRIDVTRNNLMHSDAEARQALSHLKQSPEGRQKHTFESNGFYIGKGSSLHSGKIYLKGQDARRNQKLQRALYTSAQLSKADKILRSEYMIRRHLIRRLKEEGGIDWFNLSPATLLQMHTDYFREYFSEIEVVDMSDILEKLLAVADTEGQAKSAYDCYIRIRTIGYEQAKVAYPKTTWYRHIKHLKNAGLTRADLNPSHVVPLRKRRIDVGQAVRHWDEISLAS
jgi:II/X family phage/plasmid replication protein